MSDNWLLNKHWQNVLKDELQKPYFENLCQFIKQEYKTETIFPPKEKVFNALNNVDFENIKVIILGQDPYHKIGQAEGLCFSVQNNVKLPPSLQNIFKELFNDLQIKKTSGSLMGWSKQGVLLLNTILTVKEHYANSHKDKGWEKFTGAIIEKLNQSNKPRIFILWGNQAQQICKNVDEHKHFIIKSAHPSPLSAYNGFFNSKPFSKCNAILKQLGETEIDWSK